MFAPRSLLAAALHAAAADRPARRRPHEPGHGHQRTGCGRRPERRHRRPPRHAVGHDAGWIVGYDISPGASGTPFHATLWRDGQGVDLGSGNKLSDAWDVNNRGQITGWGELAGVRVGYVLTEVSAVPAPGAWALMLSGLLAIGRIARQRRDAGR